MGKDTAQGGEYTVVHRVFCVGTYFKTHQVLIKLQYKQFFVFFLKNTGQGGE